MYVYIYNIYSIYCILVITSRYTYIMISDLCTSKVSALAIFNVQMGVSRKSIPNLPSWKGWTSAAESGGFMALRDQISCCIKRKMSIMGICFSLTLFTNNHGQTSSFILLIASTWLKNETTCWRPCGIFVHQNHFLSTLYNSPQLWQVTTREVWWYQATWKENMTPGCDPSVRRLKTHENNERNGTHLYYVWTWCHFHVCMSIDIFIKHHWTSGLSYLYTSS